MSRLLRRPTGFRLAFLNGALISACLALPIVLYFGFRSVPVAIDPWEPVRVFAAMFVIAVLGGGVCHTLPLVFQWVAYQYRSRF